jgi:hypothetical protein
MNQRVQLVVNDTRQHNFKLLKFIAVTNEEIKTKNCQRYEDFGLILWFQWKVQAGISTLSYVYRILLFQLFYSILLAKTYK